MQQPGPPISHASHYRITGGRPLQGEVTISGAKNAVTKMIIASLLTTEQFTLRNVPLLGDLYLTVKLCQALGSHVEVQEAEHSLFIRTPDITTTRVSTTVGGLNRICVMMMGPL